MSELLTLGRVRLTSDRSDDSARGGSQPKRVALLAYRDRRDGGARPPGCAPRALLAGAQYEEGRRALRQALHYLRRVVGEDVIVAAGDELSLRERALECDAVAFERLVAEGRFGDALARYHGDFFDGFHVDDVAPELEEWIDRTRTPQATGVDRRMVCGRRCGDRRRRGARDRARSVGM